MESQQRQKGECILKTANTCDTTVRFERFIGGTRVSRTPAEMQKSSIRDWELVPFHLQTLTFGRLQLCPWRWRGYCRIASLLLLVLTLLIGNTLLNQLHGQDARTSMFLSWRLATCKGNNMRSVLGLESLPWGVVEKMSDLELRPLWGALENQEPGSVKKCLLAMAVGVKQKKYVDLIVKKFLSDSFTVMLLHYDGLLDQWNDFSWCKEVVHVVAMHQTKWWFAKRFLHPDIVAPYKYIFLWDEDIGVENFNPGRYVNIVEEEGLEISQPALDRNISKIHHWITVQNPRARVHRRVYKYFGNALCWENSTAPPCTGWVEMMVPVFSRNSWRCAWHLIQNDLIHGWGLDMKLGYCVHGDRTMKIGVVDTEYVVHLGIRTLGATKESVEEGADTSRIQIRKQSYKESRLFEMRWKNAVREDKCWMDPFA